MSDNSKYYYIRLKEDFFDSEDIIIIENMKNGIIFSNILLKLYLKSLKTNGRLMVNDMIPYNTKMIAQITRQREKLVKEALEVFKSFNLIEVLENGAIYMLDIQNFIGSSSTEADRKREYDRRIAEEKKSCRNVGEISEKRTPETETEKEIEKKIDTDTKTKKDFSVSVIASASLFAIEELYEIVEKNKVDLNYMGIEKFFCEMQNTGWKLYGKDVERDYIVRALRGYANYNKKYKKSALLEDTEFSERCVYVCELDNTSETEVYSQYWKTLFVKTNEKQLLETLKNKPWLKCSFSTSNQEWYIADDDEEILDREELYGVDSEEQYRRFLAGELNLNEDESREFMDYVLTKKN